jgi:hypothetical protein
MKRRRGRPKLTLDARNFREEIARQLKAAIDLRRLTVKDAADALGVSRQAFHQYLSARATPHPETIARAMDLWHIQPSYKGQRIGRGVLGGDRRAGSHPPPTQLNLLNLFDVPQECHNENLVVTVQRSRTSMLHVTIKMKKAAAPTPGRTRDGISKAS